MNLEPDAKASNMALTDPNDICKIAYDGNLPMLQIKCRENRDLATKTDEVFCSFILFLQLGIRCSHQHDKSVQICIVTIREREGERESETY